MIHRRIPKRLCICPYGCRKSLPLLSSRSHMSVSHWQILNQSHWQVGLNHRPMQLNHALRTLSACILNIPLPLDSKVLLWISTLWLIAYDRQLRLHSHWCSAVTCLHSPSPMASQELLCKNRTEICRTHEFASIPTSVYCVFLITTWQRVYRVSTTITYISDIIVFSRSYRQRWRPTCSVD